MKRILISTLAALSLLAAAGCTTTEKRAGTGAVVGAGTGALIAAATGSSSRGVATGALIGGAAGALIGAATTPGQCRYRDANGNVYEAAC
ncbi:hypothetical protein HPDFL43_02934 [Hoeflea phototrophica DFL-43]|jgi:hypothetical protein|uniref:YMGG-like Gly-zipper domain-containing protein n=1 Tax=Hoeflea phototrophica (strain DSM 17068 / NCIMB 14078 / DFL-43) TaxID=411684 RepID=A9DD90_HOEPD|nr:YMGG-like glycine zipper-containing protein [Hoeflea phototrophica]EDQ32030.1 hypothetical protein HPDFL43_02934 [Hoeflea phototrophica DFL-43]